MFCTIKFVYYKSFCVRDDIGSYIRTVYHMVSHTPKRQAVGSNPAGITILKIPDSTNLPQIGRFPGLVFSYPETAQFMLTHSPRCLQIANIYGRFLTRSLRQAGFSCKHRRNVLLIFADGLGRISENSDVNLISGIVFGQIVVGGSREKENISRCFCQHSGQGR